MESTIYELRKFTEWCEFKTTAALRQGIELAIENYIKEKQSKSRIMSKKLEAEFINETGLDVYSGKYKEEYLHSKEFMTWLEKKAMGIS